MFDLDSLVSVYEIVQRQKQYCEEEHCIKLAKLPASSIEPRPFSSGTDLPGFKMGSP
jgi:hypothetical protein